MFIDKHLDPFIIQSIYFTHVVILTEINLGYFISTIIYLMFLISHAHRLFRNNFNFQLVLLLHIKTNWHLISTINNSIPDTHKYTLSFIHLCELLTWFSYNWLMLSYLLKSASEYDWKSTVKIWFDFWTLYISLIILILIITLKRYRQDCWTKHWKYSNFDLWDYFYCDERYLKSDTNTL